MGVQAGEVVITWLPLDFLKVIRFFFPSSWSLIRFCRGKKPEQPGASNTAQQLWGLRTELKMVGMRNGLQELAAGHVLESVLFFLSQASPVPPLPPLFSSHKQQIRSTLPVFSQGPEEFRVNKWITYLKSHLENVYTCRLARLIWLISPMGSL